jgi:hypothetical protein
MKTLKLLDFWLQIILIVVCFLLIILGSLDPLSGYFIVGGFQLIGMLIHVIKCICTYFLSDGICSTLHGCLLPEYLL